MLSLIPLTIKLSPAVRPPSIDVLHIEWDVYQQRQLLVDTWFWRSETTDTSEAREVTNQGREGDQHAPGRRKGGGGGSRHRIFAAPLLAAAKDFQTIYLLGNRRRTSYVHTGTHLCARGRFANHARGMLEPSEQLTIGRSTPSRPCVACRSEWPGENRPLPPGAAG